VRPASRRDRFESAREGATLELADYLLIAERVLGLPAEAIASFDWIGLAE